MNFFEQFFTKIDTIFIFWLVQNKRVLTHVPYYSLDNQVDNILPDFVGVDAFLLQIGPQRLQRPLVAHARVLVVVRLVVLVVLVDRVVGQVHELVADGFGRVGVFARGEAGEAVVEEVDSQRVVRGHVHVQAQIELESVDQVRIGQVFLDDAGTLFRYVLQFAHHSNALTSSTCRLATIKQEKTL